MSGEEHGEARQYSFKSNQSGSSWGKVVHVRLETDELVVQFPDRVEEHLPLTSIRGLRLRRPTGRWARRFSTRLELEDGRKYWLESPPCNGFSAFISRWWDPTGTYAPFVRTLHQALLPYQSQIAFAAIGVPRRFEAPVSLAILGLVAFFFWSWQQRLPNQPFAIAFITLVIVGSALDFWTTAYEPSAIPAGFLPN